MREVIMRYSGEGEDLHDLTRVVELVRCKDCKHWDGVGCTVHTTPMFDDDYCSMGERRHDTD